MKRTLIEEAISDNHYNDYINNNKNGNNNNHKNKK